MKPLTLLDNQLFSIVISRLCYQLIENHDNFQDTVLVGLQPRGVLLAQRLFDKLKKIQPKALPQFGTLDTTFHRDDFRRSGKSLIASNTDIAFSVENKTVIMVDDVLYTGRTIRSGLEALLDFGRPKAVELLVMIDRRFSRELPIEPRYIGKSVDSYDHQKVRVMWTETGQEDKVILLTEKE